MEYLDYGMVYLLVLSDPEFIPSGAFLRRQSIVNFGLSCEWRYLTSKVTQKDKCIIISTVWNVYINRQTDSWNKIFRKEQNISWSWHISQSQMRQVVKYFYSNLEMKLSTFQKVSIYLDFWGQIFSLFHECQNISISSN